MDSWYVLDIGNPAIETQVQDAWLAMALEAARTGTTDYSSSIWTSSGPVGDGKLYFSPTASALAKLFNAVPCEKPAPAAFEREFEGVGLLVGDARAWDIHFPGWRQAIDSIGPYSDKD